MFKLEIRDFIFSEQTKLRDDCIRFFENIGYDSDNDDDSFDEFEKLDSISAMGIEFEEFEEKREFEILDTRRIILQCLIDTLNEMSVQKDDRKAMHRMKKDIEINLNVIRAYKKESKRIIEKEEGLIDLCDNALSALDDIRKH